MAIFLNRSPILITTNIYLAISLIENDIMEDIFRTEFLNFPEKFRDFPGFSGLTGCMMEFLYIGHGRDFVFI